MVSQSKLKLVECYPCSIFIHPWSRTCIGGIISMFLSCLQGSFKLFLTVYGVKALMKRKVFIHKHYFHLLKALLQSTVCGALTGTGFVAFNCLLRNIIGKFTYRTLGFVPGALTGLAIVLEHPSQRGLMISSFLQMAIELKIIELSISGHLKLTRKNAMFIFMFCNAVIMFFLRTYSKTMGGNWFFDPFLLGCQDTNRKSALIKCIAKDGIKYFTIGLALNMVRKILECISSDQKLMQSLISGIQKPRFYAPAVFLGLYSIMFQVIHNLLEEMLGNKPGLAALLSGFLSGTSSWFIQPNLPLISTAMSSILLMICKTISNGMSKPFQFYGEIIYIICSGFIFQARALHQDICPHIVKEVMSKATSKRSDEMANAFTSSILKIEKLIE